MISIGFYQEELPERCSSWELPGATGDISLLKVLCYMCCLLVYLHFVDCHHVLLLTLRHPLGFVPPNHRQRSLSIFSELCDWRWSHLLGKSVKVHSPFVKSDKNTLSKILLKSHSQHSIKTWTFKSGRRKKILKVKPQDIMWWQGLHLH